MISSAIAQYNTEIVPKLENRYNVQYPALRNATYVSLVNYATDLKAPIQRWYRYKEGYSVKLVQQLFDEYGVERGDIVLDPFCGSGSTIIQAKTIGAHGIGFEVNPFSAFLAKVKTQHYNEADLNNFVKEKQILRTIDNTTPVADKPILSIVDRLFKSDVLDYFLRLKSSIFQIENERVRDLIFLAWLSILEEASDYRKAGNGLKIRRGKNLLSRNLEYAKLLFFSRLYEIEIDLPFAIRLSQGIPEPKIFEHNSLEMERFVKPNTVKGVIFSPPYANCFDYTEIYKVELWFGGFVNDYSDLKTLRNLGIRSHLNGYNGESSSKALLIDELGLLTEELENTSLWDKRIPSMVKGYFSDMFTALDKIYDSLKPGGFCSIIVSSSAYGGIVVPTDLLLTRYAESIGFDPLRVEVARFIITSSQQYKQTERFKKYLRESIIHLKK